MLPNNTAWLSIILFLPLLTGIVILLLRRLNRAILGALALIGSLGTLVLAILLYCQFDPDAPGWQMEEIRAWIPSIGARYHLGMDGVSLGLTLLTVFLAPIVVVYLLPRLREDAGALLFTILALETTILGVLLSLDVLLFYVFWEAMLIPMYFLISVWGAEGRARASLKFILYMMAGSLLMLAGILWYYWLFFKAAHFFSFDLVHWIILDADPIHHISPQVQSWIFGFFFLSFAIKVPLFPFHSWLPDAQEQGPVAFNVLLIEVGAFAFIRFCMYLFPMASLDWAPAIMTLAVINVIYGAVMATIQTDLKRLFAYAAMSHAGFIMLGIFSMTVQGMEGGILYMINSGLTGAGLFIIADLLYRRRRSRLINEFGGLARRMPLLFFFFLIIALGAIGLPGLNGFTSEFLVLLGAIRTPIVSPWFGYLSGMGVVLSAVYMLWMFQRVMYGRLPVALENAPTLDLREKVSLWPIVLVVIFIGVGSAVFTRPMDKSVEMVRTAIQRGTSLTSYRAPTPDASSDSSVVPESPAQ